MLSCPGLRDARRDAGPRGWRGGTIGWFLVLPRDKQWRKSLEQSGFFEQSEPLGIGMGGLQFEFEHGFFLEQFLLAERGLQYVVLLQSLRRIQGGFHALGSLVQDLRGGEWMGGALLKVHGGGFRGRSEFEEPHGCGAGA
ncbi:MAG: hypothetical protein RLZZ244_1140 [Verrucomicrobiota bacterium]